MRVLSVNVASIRNVSHGGETVPTGIFKVPVQGRTLATTLGLRGDHQADKVHHGGVDMALYAFTQENYDHWSRVLGRTDLVPGKFGENLTVSGMPDTEVCIGDRFRMGEIEVEVSSPRGPCFKLGIAVGDAEFPKAFLNSCNVGFYLRVIREGTVAAGDAIERTHTDAERLSVHDTIRLMYFGKEDKAAAARAAGVGAMADQWKTKFRQRAEQPS